MAVSPFLQPEPAVGAGLKPEHFATIAAEKPALGFFEVHAENYMGDGGPLHHWLAKIRRDYPLSVHGVCLSLGSSDPLDTDHLRRLVSVVERYEPFLVSEHLAWSSFDGQAFPDLLPCPYDSETLARVVDHVDQAQTALGRTLLLENPATYLRFAGDALSETDFLAEVAARSGCGLLLDVNNVHVSAVNHGFDATSYLDAFPMQHVGEMHLAGFAEARDANGVFLIDDHGAPVSAEVWSLYDHALRRLGPCPTLVEWDNNIPKWSCLFVETQKALAHQQAAESREARDALV
jgi:uncharacterized protein (UPF0276 family)